MIDGHIHFAQSMDEKLLNEIIEKYQLEAVALQCIPKGGRFPVEKDALAFRKQSKVPVYIFGGIARDIFEFPKEHLADELCNEIDRLLLMGCDGIKMLEGKPDVRKQYPIPDFDSVVWEGYWNKLEREQIPVVFHVNDPEEFWNAKEVTEFAKNAGWFYDESYISNEEQYRQVLTVLEKYPRLNICFPHFLFFSKQLERLSKILRTYQNVMIDVTPASEQYFNLSDRIEETKLFFDEFRDRICYGTDIGARELIREEDAPMNMQECHARISFVKSFLEAKEDYYYVPDGVYVREGHARTIHRFGLSAQQLELIYKENFMRFLKKRKSRGM